VVVGDEESYRDWPAIRAAPAGYQRPQIWLDGAATLVLVTAPLLIVAA